MSHKDIPERQLTEEQKAASSAWSARVQASMKATGNTEGLKRERPGQPQPANKNLGWVVLIIVGVGVVAFMFWPK